MPLLARRREVGATDSPLVRRQSAVVDAMPIPLLEERFLLFLFCCCCCCCMVYATIHETD